jgi:hypothetical protein
MNPFEPFDKTYRKGGGAQINPANHFENLAYNTELDIPQLEQETVATTYINVFPKTMVNSVTSPDLPMDWSVNP